MAAGGLLVLGALMAASAALGRPRLSVSATGVRLDWLLRTQWAAWQSLGAFQVATTPAPLGRGARLTARARIVGANVSRSLRGKRQFMIPDRFHTPVGTLVTEINEQHPNTQDHGAARHLGGIPYAEENRVGIKAFATPWLTFALLGGLVAVFVLEQKYAIGPLGPGLGPSLATLQALGAVSGEAVLTHGEWYRLFTAPLLHANVWHLVGNGTALFMAGYVLENLAGRAWLAALFVVGGLGGAVMSMAVNPATLTSVGASGAIMALFAAGLISSFRMSPGPSRWLVQANFVGTVITSIMPLAATAGATKVDYAAHIGGALAGAVCGLILLCSWPAASASAAVSNHGTRRRRGRDDAGLHRLGGGRRALPRLRRAGAVDPAGPNAEDLCRHATARGGAGRALPAGSAFPPVLRHRAGRRP